VQYVVTVETDFIKEFFISDGTLFSKRGEVRRAYVIKKIIAKR